MRIKKAPHAGFCWGVKRAINLVNQNLNQLERPLMMNGYLVHNEEVVEKLFTNRGIEIINDLRKTDKGTLIITAHGISPKEKNRLSQRKSLNLLDTTCPKVLSCQKLAYSLYKQGRQVLIFGDDEHQEVKGIKGATDDTAIVFSSKEEFQQLILPTGRQTLDPSQKYGMIVQTTKSPLEFEDIRKQAEKNLKDIKIFNTICEATRRRQEETRELAKECDIMIIIGSKKSANTTRLYEISSDINSRTYFINKSQELEKYREDFLEDNPSPSKSSPSSPKSSPSSPKIGINAGASTPDWIINEVIEKLKNFSPK